MTQAWVKSKRCHTLAADHDRRDPATSATQGSQTGQRSHSVSPQAATKQHKDVLVLTHEIGSYTCPFADDRAHDGHQCCSACMQVLGHSMESARMAVSASYYDQTVPWYERLTVDCPLTGGCVCVGGGRWLQ
jgi:hypothetical protein